MDMSKKNFKFTISEIIIAILINIIIFYIIVQMNYAK